MASLFVDTSYDITLGLLGDDLTWLNFKRFRGQKASSVIQTETYHMCQQLGIQIHEIKSLFTIAGPGFYTGLRLSEGFADVFKFFGVPHFSFFSYEIPAILGKMSGVWMTKAYRGEYFFYTWDGSQTSSTMVASADLDAHTTSLRDVFIHSDSSLDERASKLLGPVQMTHDLLEREAQIIFQFVQDNRIQRESFYFRAPEDEFRVGT